MRAESLVFAEISPLLISALVEGVKLRLSSPGDGNDSVVFTEHFAETLVPSPLQVFGEIPNRPITTLDIFWLHLESASIFLWGRGEKDVMFKNLLWPQEISIQSDTLIGGVHAAVRLRGASTIKSERSELAGKVPMPILAGNYFVRCGQSNALTNRLVFVMLAPEASAFEKAPFIFNSGSDVRILHPYVLHVAHKLLNVPEKLK